MGPTVDGIPFDVIDRDDDSAIRANVGIQRKRNRQSMNGSSLQLGQLGRRQIIVSIHIRKITRVLILCSDQVVNLFGDVLRCPSPIHVDLADDIPRRAFVRLKMARCGQDLRNERLARPPGSRQVKRWIDKQFEAFESRDS